MTSSPFSDVPSSDWVASNRSAYAIRDGAPAGDGHSLIVPRREIASWWDAFPEEQQDMLALLTEVKDLLDVDLAPDGYSIGIDNGAAAGQSVEHLHIHLIPRWTGDASEVPAGIRSILDSPGGKTRRHVDGTEVYLEVSPDTPPGFEQQVATLVAGPGQPLHPELVECLTNPGFDRVDLIVSFVMLSGLDLIGGGLEDAIDRGAYVRVLATDYLGITESAALGWLLDRSTTGVTAVERTGRLDVRIFSDPLTSFHPKSYLFWSSPDGPGLAFVGSSNMSRSGLRDGVEWNLRTSEVPLLRAGFDSLWADQRTVPLTEDWLSKYRPSKRRHTGVAVPPHSDGESTGEADGAEPAATPEAVDAAPGPGPDGELPTEAPVPTPIQDEALVALEANRTEGHTAGLVVMATGLGKTWLAAFDSARFSTGRMLFIAHREEILFQARDVFRRVRPESTIGMFTGDERSPDADIVFGSVQSVARHLDRFERDAFDYVVVDEFHHAAASTYRQVIDYFVPSFLLGLTATPERMDGADLLALCGGNLVFECGLTEGIDRSELVPFHYWGVPDVVDFEPIPWRNGRFDPEELVAAVTTQERADHAIREWSDRRGARTLAFCASTVHADFMADQFRQVGIRAAAVHSGATSAPRRQSLVDLAEGRLDVICSVDVFNEGVDLPAVDTVLMLRPTASPTIFLQQLGRGLRRSDDKTHLRVIDFIGNHRSFLMRPRTLLSLGSRSVPSTRQTLDALETGSFELPAGCQVDYDLEAIELLQRLRPAASAPDVLADYCRSYADEHSVRPTAAQAWRSGLNPKSAAKAGGWFEFLRDQGLLTDEEVAVLDRYQDFLQDLETTALSKSHKLVTLRALIHEGGLRVGVDVSQLADVAQRIVSNDRRLVDDVRNQELPEPAEATPDQWRRYWRKFPIAAWIGEHRQDGKGWFHHDGDHFAPSFSIDADDEDALVALVAELVDYRLIRYLEERRGDAGSEEEAMVCRVGHASGRPLIWLDRRTNSAMPEGTVPFIAGDVQYEGDFRKEALNVARLPGSDGNDLHALLRGWFGPSAGLPGTSHRVRFTVTAAGLAMEPVALHDTARAEHALPLFPTFAIACGAFDDPSRIAHDATTIDLQISGETDLDRNRHFVAFARGESMAGGSDPIHHGDPLLFEWVPGIDRKDLIGERVLVELHRTDGKAASLKRLERRDGQYLLVSDNNDVAPIEGASDMRIIARLKRRLTQSDVNPLVAHIGEGHARASIRALHGDPEGKTNWQQGHVTLPAQAILLVTLDKADMPGVDYVDHFEGRETFVWSSQASTSPEGKRGREILEALETGTELHLWARPKKKDRSFRYLGLVLPIGHKGSKPMSVTFRLLTPLDNDLATLFSLSG